MPSQYYTIMILIKSRDMECSHFCLSHFTITSLSCHGKEKGEEDMTSGNMRAIFYFLLCNLSKAQVLSPQKPQYMSLMYGERKFFLLLPSKNNSNNSLHLINI